MGEAARKTPHGPTWAATWPTVGGPGLSKKPQGPGDPTALTVEQLAELLSLAARKKISSAGIRADVKAGAPTNGDGTLHLVHYAAWLVSQSR